VRAAHTIAFASAVPVWYRFGVSTKESALAGWTSEQIANGQRWVRAWREAAPALEGVRRRELRQLDAGRALALLCGPADYRVPPRAPKPTSGLIEQQRWFKKARGCD
jgi:hypothetical protein